MKILSIETSCDETSAAIVEEIEQTNKVHLLANVTATSLPLHAQTGGIIPEVAARQQLRFILPVIEEALHKGIAWEPPYRGGQTVPSIDAIAVTIGPGLIGSLLVGVETAKTLAYVWKKPIIPVNHLFGHIYANWLLSDKDSHKGKGSSTIAFPALALVISGGHTDLVYIKKHGEITWIGGTRDDAAGEAFDKIGRLLGLAYPAGPVIEKFAQKGRKNVFHFPRPLVGSGDFDFSFSGLKTAVLREVQKIKNLDEQVIADICLETQNAIIDVVKKKTITAAKKYDVKTILLGGGVAANQTLVNQLKVSAEKELPEVRIKVPDRSLCTDNAAMIGAAAFFNNNPLPWQEITANPELYFD